MIGTGRMELTKRGRKYVATLIINGKRVREKVFDTKHARDEYLAKCRKDAV